MKRRKHIRSLFAHAPYCHANRARYSPRHIIDRIEPGVVEVRWCGNGDPSSFCLSAADSRVGSGSLLKVARVDRPGVPRVFVRWTCSARRSSSVINREARSVSPPSVGGVGNGGKPINRRLFHDPWDPLPGRGGGGGALPTAGS
jgi:hypothetical protein